MNYDLSSFNCKHFRGKIVIKSYNLTTMNTHLTKVGKTCHLQSTTINYRIKFIHQMKKDFEINFISRLRLRAKMLIIISCLPLIIDS